MSFSKNMENDSEKADEVSRAARPDSATKRYPEQSFRYQGVREIPEQTRHSHEHPEKRRIFMTPRVEGFESSGVMSNEEVKQYLKTFPEMHVNNITMESVRYNDLYVGDDQAVELGHWENREVVEGLDVHDKNIVINRQCRYGCDDVQSMKETIAHEVGHHVFRVNLKKETDLKKDWEVISGDRPADKCVSEYARTSSSEDFAESYLHYVLYPGDLQRINPEKHDFMKRHVFKGSK